MSHNKVIILGRHGKHQKNILTPEAVKKAYDFGESLRKKHYKDNSLDIRDCFIIHSGQPRTIETAKSILSGIFSGKIPKYIQTRRDKPVPIDIPITRCALLGYEDIEYNEKAMYEKYEEEEYMKIWAANPDSTDFEGQPITCYNEMLRRGKACLINTINDVKNYNFELGILNTHLSIVEPIFMAAINSARKGPCTLEEIGGAFEPGECAELILKPNREYGYSEGKLIRNQKSYDVDLTNLLSICEE